MKKILCPTDFSNAGINGIAYAAKLSKKIGADLTLFNVVALTDLLPEEVLMGEQSNVVNAVKERLEVQSREVTRVFKISCYGDAETTLTSVSQVVAAKAQDFDLVVMGTNGVDDLAQFFMGSSTYQAIRKVNKPVIMVPEDIVYCEPEQIVYAYDYLGHHQLPLVQLISFMKLIKCRKLTILQIMEEPISKDAEEEIAQVQLENKNKYQDDADLTFKTTYASSTAEAIKTYMEKNQGDMLALCSEHRSFIASIFHKSVIKSITGSAHFPVFVFHA